MALFSPQHENYSRRTMLQVGSVGLLGLGINHLAALREARAALPWGASEGKARSVIFIFLSGGLSQHDSFDPKPEAPANIRGEFASIPTQTPGLHICEHLPLLARQSHRWSLIRSLTTPYNEHSQGHLSILTGRTPLPPSFDPAQPTPQDWPSIAAVVGDQTRQRKNNLPPAVVLPERLVHRTGRVIPGQFGGQMGDHRDPWFIEASPFNANTYGAYPDYEFHFVRGRQRTENLRFQAPNLQLPQGLTFGQLENRMRLLRYFNGQQRQLEHDAIVESFDRYRQSAVSLLTDPRLQKALHVHRCADSDLDRYGRNAFGWSLLMARNLVEHGVPLIQVNLGNNETWDTHENNFPLLRDCLLPPTDRAVCALLDDLAASGSLEETLIVMCGEMGRTPRINAGTGESKIPGRDHWGAVQSVFIAGGGVPGGCVVGASDREGAYPSEKPQTPENLAATIYHSLGIPATAVWKDQLDRPHHVYHGDPIRFT